MTEEAGARDAAVVAAMRSVPRHWFLDRAWEGQAYDDTPLPIGPGATISAPHMVAIQLETAQLHPGLRVLEVGSGCGYLCALIARCVGPRGTVRGLEFEPQLVEESRRVIERLGLSPLVAFRASPGEEGWDEEAPFDRILVSYEVVDPPPSTWCRELVEGGKLVVPLRSGRGTYLERFRRAQGGLVREQRGPACVFVGSKRHGGVPKV